MSKFIELFREFKRLADMNNFKTNNIEIQLTLPRNDYIRLRAILNKFAIEQKANRGFSLIETKEVFLENDFQLFGIKFKLLENYERKD